MPENKNTTRKPWVDPDDAPTLPREFFMHAEISENGKVIRPATGSLEMKSNNRINIRFSE